MAEKKIKIFLGSSLVEFKDLRESLTNFIDGLSDSFKKKYETSLYILRCDDGLQSPFISSEGTQTEINKLIDESDICLFIFGDKIGEYTKEEFEYATKLFLESNDNPKIAVYFKKDTNNVEIEEFKRYISNEFKYYYKEFDNEWTMKLSVLVGINLSMDKVLKIEIKNGKCLVDGEELFDGENLTQIKNNKELNSLKKELNELLPRYYELRKQYEDETLRKEVYFEYSKIASKRINLIEKIEELESDIFKLSLDMVENSMHGTITKRMNEAYSYLDEGEYDKALAIMDFGVITDEYELEEKLDEMKSKAKAKNYINELELRIEILKSMSIKEKYDEIEKCYDSIFNQVKKHGVRFDCFSDYLRFLANQKKYNKAKEVTDEIKIELSHYKNDIEDKEFASIYLDLGHPYRFLKDYKQAEEFYLKSKVIIESLAKDNPKEYNKDLARTYRMLGSLYSENLHDYNLSKEYYLKCKEIRESLAKENPEVYSEDLAFVYKRLGNVYSDLSDYKTAKEYYIKCKEILEELAKDNLRVAGKFV